MDAHRDDPVPVRTARFRAEMLRDHERLERCMQELADGAQAGVDPRSLHALWDELDHVLSAHLAAEERHLFPRLRHRHPRMVAELEVEHAAFREALVQLGVAVDLHVVRAGAIADLVERLRAHAAREDATVYAWAEEELEPPLLLEVVRLLAGASEGSD